MKIYFHLNIDGFSNCYVIANENSKEAIRQVSDISKNKLNSYKLNNYRFSENNVLKEETLASSGEYSEHANVSVATRTYGDYSYTLSVW